MMSEDLEPSTAKGKSKNHSGWSCLSVSLVLLIIIGVPSVLFMNSMNKLVRRSSGANDLAEPLIAAMCYAKDHDGALPPLDPKPGRLVFERRIMYEKYGVTGRTMTMEFDAGAPYRWADYDKDPALRGNTEFIDDHSWWYLGYVVRSDAEGIDFLRAYQNAALEGTGFAGDIPIPGTDRKVPRLHLLNEPQDDRNPNSESAKTPVFIERPGHYRGYSGGHVAYLDGHIEYHDYPGAFPMSAGFIRALQAIDHVGEALTDR
jgi:hypothetical protein